MRGEWALRVVTPAGKTAWADSIIVAARKACHVDHAEDDDEIKRKLRSALDWVHSPAGWLGRSVLPQTLRLDMPRWCYKPIDLPAIPIGAVSSVKYFDANNVEQTLSPSAYFLDEDTLLWTASFPDPQLYDRPTAVRITYTAGYEDADRPELLTEALLALAAHWYDNREAAAIVGEFAMIPLGAVDALNTFRVW